MLSLSTIPQERAAPERAWQPQSRSAPSTLAECFQIAAVRRLEPREHLFCEGDPRTHVYRVETGALCLYKVMADGRRQIVSFALPGDLVGLGTGLSHMVSAQATSPTRLRSLATGALDQAARQDPSLGHKLYEALSDDLHSACDLILTVGQRGAIERVAAFLLAIGRRSARRGQAGSIIVLPMTRTDIADFLGLTIETVSRSFTKLKTSSVIRLIETSVVELVDKEALQRLADGAEREAA